MSEPNELTAILVKRIGDVRRFFKCTFDQSQLKKRSLVCSTLAMDMLIMMPVVLQLVGRREKGINMWTIWQQAQGICHVVGALEGMNIHSVAGGERRCICREASCAMLSLKCGKGHGNSRGWAEILGLMTGNAGIARALVDMAHVSAVLQNHDSGLIQVGLFSNSGRRGERLVVVLVRL